MLATHGKKITDLLEGLYLDITSLGNITNTKAKPAITVITVKSQGLYMSICPYCSSKAVKIKRFHILEIKFVSQSSMVLPPSINDSYSYFALTPEL